MAAYKKIHIFFLALVLCLSLAGCGEKTEKPQQQTSPSGMVAGPTTGTPGTTGIPGTTGTVPSTTTGTVPPTTTGLTAEDIDLPADGWSMLADHAFSGGAFGAGGYYSWYDQILTFTDLSSGTQVVLCSIPGCLHYDLREAEKPDCDAYIGMANCLHYHEGKIYYVTSRRGEDGYWLTRRNADGTAEERIGRLASEFINQDSSVTMVQYIFAGDMLYYRVDVTRSRKEEGVTVNELAEQHLMRMELTSGENEILERDLTTEAPLLLGAREDMLLYRTVPRLTKEEEEADPDQKYERMQSLKVWSEDVGQSVILFADKWKSVSLGSLHGGKCYYWRYDDFESGERHYKTYDLVTREHEETNLQMLPNLAGRYVLSFDENHKDYLYDAVTESMLQIEYDDLHLSIRSAGPEGVILHILRPPEEEGESYDHVEYRYVLYSELEDGIQKTDGVVLQMKK